MTLPELATAVLRRLRDPEADFELQVLVRDESQSLWLSRRGPRLQLLALGAGGGEVDWERSAFKDLDPVGAFTRLADRLDLVVLFVGGPLPEELMGLFLPDEAGPSVRYRAEWGGWKQFEDWLGG